MATNVIRVNAVRSFKTLATLVTARVHWMRTLCFWRGIRYLAAVRDGTLRAGITCRNVYRALLIADDDSGIEIVASLVDLV